MATLQDFLLKYFDSKTHLIICVNGVITIQGTSKQIRSDLVEGYSATLKVIGGTCLPNGLLVNCITKGND